MQARKQRRETDDLLEESRDRAVGMPDQGGEVRIRLSPFGELAERGPLKRNIKLLEDIVKKRGRDFENVIIPKWEGINEMDIGMRNFGVG